MRRAPWFLCVACLAPFLACGSGTSDSAPGGGDTSSSTTGGNVGSGGNTSGGGPGAGGALGSGGQATGGGSSSGGGTSTLFQVEAHLASEDDAKAPTTVGIVSWSILGGTPSSATIQFGLTTDYGMQAPVDVTAEELRTLLLGMKPEHTYHFRITAELSGESLVSEDYTLTTGSAPPETLVDPIKYEVLSAAQREPGFIVTSYWNETQPGMVFILDPDGDVVWWYNSGLSSGVGRAAISDDGRDMWMISAAASLNEPLRRVGMDGLGLQTYSNVVGSHDIIPMEGDVMAFVGLITATEVNRAGQTKAIFPILDVSAIPPPHCNALGYNKALGTYVVSDLTEDVYMFPRAGGTPENIELLTSILGPNSGWGGFQHGVQLLSNNHLLMFANNEGQDLSTAIEYNLDDGEEVWRYEGNQYSANFGGVQRLPGGNTLVTYSNAGVIHETTPEQVKVLEITTDEHPGYATWRPSLYGPSVDVEE